MLAVVKECYPSQGKFSESLSFRPRNFSILTNCNPGLPSYIKTIMYVFIRKLQTAIWRLLKLEIHLGTTLTNDFTTKCIFQSFRNVSNYFVVFFLCEDEPQILRFLLGPTIFLYTSGMQDGDIYLFTLSLKSYICFWDLHILPLWFDGFFRQACSSMIFVGYK